MLDSELIIVDPFTVRGFAALVRSRGIIAAIVATVREARS